MKFKYECGRKVVHISWIFLLIVYIFLEKRYGRIALILPWGLFTAIFIFDVIRLKLRKKLPFFHRLLRKKDVKGFFTPTTTVLGTALTLTLFELDIAALAIIMMVFGDVAGTMVGLHGKLKIYGKKTLEGSVAQFIVNIIAGYIYLPNIFLVSSMALVATIAELLCKKLDDNLIIQIIAGATGQLLKFLF